MPNSLIQVPPDSTGKKVATFQKTEGGQSVEVQKVLLAGQTADDDIVPKNAAPEASDYALPIRKGDGHDVALGAKADAEATGDGSVIAILKRLRSLLGSFFDVDTGAGTQNVLGVSMRKAASGGSVELGTITDPVRTDPTGTTTQPVSVAATLQVDVTDEAARDLGKVDIASLDQYAPESGRLPVATTGTRDVHGNLAHDAAETGNPVAIGALAVAHGTSPTAVAAADRVRAIANRHGVPFTIGGHPNVVTVRANYTAAQTDAAIVSASAGQKIVVTRCSVLADKANTVDVQARVGFGATNTPTTTGVVLSHPGIAAGSGVIEGSGAGILGVGADGEDLRITSEVPTGGSIDVVVSYYIVES